MDIVLLGVNHRSAPLDLRERLDFSRYPAERYLDRLVQRESVQSGLVLSTCNRVEVYATGCDEARLLRDVRLFVADFHGVGETDLAPFLYEKSNTEAVRHLFRVASSLDSMVVGEPQILGQVKDAYAAAQAAAFTDPLLDRLFRKALSVAKRVRCETDIARQAVSISTAAVDLARRIFGSLRERTVMVLGAGEMAELAARHLAERSVKEMYFSNRSYDRAVEMARRYGGIPVAFDHHGTYLARADIVIVSTSAPEYLIGPEAVQEILRKRKRAPVFFIDISVPRNVDPRVAELEDAYLYNVDDLQKTVHSNLEARREEAEKAERIVEAEVGTFFRAARQMEQAPAIREIVERYEEIRQSEMGRLKGRLKDLPPEALEEIDQATQSLVRKILSRPISFLKEREETEVLREIFGLGPRRGSKP
jgi:glutamyl-tRNA reductase